MKFASQNHTGAVTYVTCARCNGPVVLADTGRPRVHPFCDAPDCRKAAAAARGRASRAGKRLPPLDPPMLATTRSVHGSNAALIAAAARLYAADGSLVLDVSYGHGAFWARTGGRLNVIGSDLRHVEGAGLVADFCRLPYADRCADVVVLDPPYVHQGPNGHYLDHQYAGARTTASFDHADIIELYRRGMVEGLRVLREGGTLWVKTMDSVESGRQRWSHVELYLIAQSLGMQALDLFVLVPAPIKTRRWRRQQHARKGHSYLWIFA